MGDILANNRVGIRTPVGDDVPLQITKPEIQINGIGVEDDAETPTGIINRGGGRILCRIDHSRIGCPPAHITSSLEQVAVDQLDCIEGQIDKALALGLIRHDLDAMLQIDDAVCQIRFEFSGDAFDAAADGSNLLSHHGKPGPMLTGAGGLDHRIQGKNFHLAGYLPDAAGLLGREITHFGCDIGDVLQLDPFQLIGMRIVHFSLVIMCRSAISREIT